MRIPGTRALASGFVGAAILTLLHQTQRKVVANPPRLDLLGMRAIAKSMRATGAEPPQGESLDRTALVGDLISNAAYFSLAATTRQPVTTGGLLGLAAGVGSVFLPGYLGLGEDATRRTRQTEAMTVALYTIGGLTAGAAYSLLTDREWPSEEWSEAFFPASETDNV